MLEQLIDGLSESDIAWLIEFRDASCAYYGARAVWIGGHGANGRQCSAPAPLALRRCGLAIDQTMRGTRIVLETGSQRGPTELGRQVGHALYERYAA